MGTTDEANLKQSVADVIDDILKKETLVNHQFCIIRETMESRLLFLLMTPGNPTHDSLAILREQILQICGGNRYHGIKDLLKTYTSVDGSTLEDVIANLTPADCGNCVALIDPPCSNASQQKVWKFQLRM